MIQELGGKNWQLIYLYTLTLGLNGKLVKNPSTFKRLEVEQL
jgi:hypothetical protein